MFPDEFLFTSGLASVNNESLDYGIKRIPGVFPVAWLKKLQKFCSDHLQAWFTLMLRGNQAVIICAVESGKLVIAIPLRLRHGRDHVGRENLVASGPLLYQHLPGTEPDWQLIVAANEGLLATLLEQSFAASASRSECHARIADFWRNLPGDRTKFTPRVTSGQLIVAAAFVLAVVLVGYWCWGGSRSNSGARHLDPASHPPANGDKQQQIATWLRQRLQSPEFIAAVKEINAQGWPQHDPRLARLLAYFREIGKQLPGAQKTPALPYRDLVLLDLNYRQPPARVALRIYASIQLRLHLTASAREARLYRQISKRTE